jgi:cbb3-type cytochrome oxidase subunit 3
VKDMTMETIAILGIALIITLMLGVVAFAYKASPIRPVKR